MTPTGVPNPCVSRWKVIEVSIGAITELCTRSVTTSVP